MKVGDKVVKTSDYKWPGEIVAVFEHAGETRVVVECTAKEAAGALHIFNWEQLTRRPRLCEDGWVLTACFGGYEWNAGLDLGNWGWGPLKDPSGVGFHVGPLLFRKWR